MIETTNPENPFIYLFDLRIADSMIGQGQAAEAEASLRSLLELWRPRMGDHWRLDQGTNILGHSVSVQDRCDEAEELLVGSFERLLVHNRARAQRAALDRLSEHFERCGKPQATAHYAAMLDGAPG